jgi:hypothetical protein
MYGSSVIRPPRRARQKYRGARTIVTVDRALLEWGKAQPEGFSGLVRALLQAEYRRREGLQLAPLTLDSVPLQPAAAAPAAAPPAASARPAG